REHRYRRLVQLRDDALRSSRGLAGHTGRVLRLLADAVRVLRSQPGARPSAIGALRVMTRVLVTNDDGVEAQGIHVLSAALCEEGYDVVVVAPDRDRSGTGAAIGLVHADQ